jgi:hypothetical protein
MLGGMKGVPHIPGPCVPFCMEPPRDAAIARLAEGLHTVVSLAQLRALALSDSGVRKRVASGRLHRIHHGVYAVGHGRLTREGQWMAAVLAYGPTARLSHRSAAALWNVRPDNRPTADVSLPRRSARSRPGIAAHASATLTAADCTTVDGIPGRLRHPRHAPLVRARPPPRPAPQAGRLRPAALHPPPDPQRAGQRGRNPRRAARSGGRNGASLASCVPTAPPASTSTTRSPAGRSQVS